MINGLPIKTCVCIKNYAKRNDTYRYTIGEVYKYQVVSHYISPDVWRVYTTDADYDFYEVSKDPCEPKIIEYFQDIQTNRDSKLKKLLK
jgi:hypothetical protein